MTLRERLTAAIREQEAELAAIETRRAAEVAACEARLVLLRQALGGVSRELDATYGALVKAGVIREVT